MTSSDRGQQRYSRARAIFEVASAIAVTTAALIIIWEMAVAPWIAARSSPESRIPSAPISFAGAPIKGSHSAKIAILEFSDFECPFCGKFSRETLPALDREFVDSGLVLIAFLHFPLKIHPFALPAAEAAECANRQGQFWSAHDLFFRNQQDLTPAALREDGRTLGLDVSVFEACLGDSGRRVRVDEDLSVGTALGIRGTPALFIGNVVAGEKVQVVRHLSGARPLPEFEAAIEEARKVGAGHGQ